VVTTVIAELFRAVSVAKLLANSSDWALGQSPFAIAPNAMTPAQFALPPQEASANRKNSADSLDKNFILKILYKIHFR